VTHPAFVSLPAGSTPLAQKQALLESAQIAMASHAYQGKRPLLPVAEMWSWQLLAACREADPAIFFHPEGERAGARRRRQQRAKAISAQCPVIAQCSDHALRFGEDFGIWGGLSEDDRRRMLGQLRIRAKVRVTD
jgi:WhiB family transcriptional regulator, redox-sensing transcriptional regulator